MAAKNRNQRMDCYKGVAIYAVIAIHVLFPGQFGLGVQAVGRFAVPFFFLTAGYFSLGAAPLTLIRRFVRCFFQLAFACLLYLPLGAAMAAGRGLDFQTWLSNLFNRQTLERFLTHHTIPLPYAWQLWFLGALMMVYLLWWAITTLSRSFGRNVPYDGLALLSLALLALHLWLGEGRTLMGLEGCGQLLRNAALDGLPFFALGSWCAWRRKQIKKWPVPWALLILLGGGLSVLERSRAGSQELYLGTLLLLTGLMGRSIRYRRVGNWAVIRALAYCGQRLTLYIFILHMLVLAAIRELPALHFLDSGWYTPILVAVLSTLLSLIPAKLFHKEARP